MQRLSFHFNPIIIHPLLTFTISLMLGIWYASGSSSVLFIGLGVAACSAYYLLSIENYKATILPIALCIIGFLLGAGLAHYQRTTHAAKALSLQEGPYDIIAKVVSVQTADKTSYAYTVQLSLIKIKKSFHDSSWQSNKSMVTAFCHILPFLEPDDVVYLEECSLSKHNPTSDFNKYLIKSGIHGTLFCHHLTYTLLQRPTFSYARAINRCRNQLFDRVRSKMSEENAAFYSSLFLGNCHTYKKFLKGMKSDFGIWGLSHFLARSGLHLVLFIYLWHLLLGYIPIRSRNKYISMLALNAIYLLLSWSSLSFMRSFSSVCFYYLAHIFQQQPSTLHVITMITCGCLLLNPMQLFFLDFQLSFGLTFALAWIYQTYSWQQLKLTANS